MDVPLKKGLKMMYIQLFYFFLKRGMPQKCAYGAPVRVHKEVLKVNQLFFNFELLNKKLSKTNLLNKPLLDIKPYINKSILGHCLFLLSSHRKSNVALTSITV